MDLAIFAGTTKEYRRILVNEDLLRLAIEVHDLDSIKVQRDTHERSQVWDQITEYYNQKMHGKPEQMKTKAQLQMSFRNRNRIGERSRKSDAKKK